MYTVTQEGKQKVKSLASCAKAWSYVNETAVVDKFSKCPENVTLVSGETGSSPTSCTLIAYSEFHKRCKCCNTQEIEPTIKIDTSILLLDNSTKSVYLCATNTDMQVVSRRIDYQIIFPIEVPIEVPIEKELTQSEIDSKTQPPELQGVEAGAKLEATLEIKEADQSDGEADPVVVYSSPEVKDKEGHAYKVVFEGLDEAVFTTTATDTDF